VTRALWLAALALPLAAQPKLLINAKLDTRSVASGLEPAFHALLAAEPQPAWVGYTVPAVRAYGLGCEFVSRDGSAAFGPDAGVVHLEPPDHAVILFRLVGNAVERIRALSPDCEIDAGGVPVHWLTDVQPAESVALLAGFVEQSSNSFNGAIHAIAMHSDPAADRALDRFLAPAEPESIRLRAVGVIGSTRGRHGLDVLQNLIANDPDMRVKRRAVSALQSLPGGQGIPLLIDLVKTTQSPEIRKQAMSTLENTHDPRALAFFEQVLKQTSR